MSQIYTHVLGCKVNFADVKEIADLLPAPQRPVALVGTCCVTAEGQKQSRKEVRRAARRVGPTGKVLVAGCAARLNPEEFRNIAENVEVLTGEAELAGWISGNALSRAAAELSDTPSFGGEAQNPSAQQRTRFFLKIQDGCANRCAYCVIPQVRGLPRSVPIGQVLNRAGSALAAGYLELVVTGINVGAYRNGVYGLPWLLDTLAGTQGLRRLRISSIEINHVTPELVDVIGRHEVIGRHLHLPLQSGDDGVLAAMGRRYRRSDFSGVTEMLRRALPGINITTDVIVGYPSEDEAAFANTLAFLEETGFSKIHVFAFSPRPGTKAEGLGDPVPGGEKKRRSRLVREISDRLQAAHMQRKVGALSEILLESVQRPGVHGGYSSDYTRFVVQGGHAGEFVKARASAVTGDGLIGIMESDD